MTSEELKDFEAEVAVHIQVGHIKAPVHLSGGNEEQLIEIFKEVKPEDWVLSTWRSHYHALLKGIPREAVMAEILAGRSMMLHFPEHKFLTSSIVGGILPIACGLAATGEKVWCFVGDMAATTGIYHEAIKYANGFSLPVQFVVEDNELSTNTPTNAAWKKPAKTLAPIQSLQTWYQRYFYTRTYPHYGVSPNVPF